MLFVHSIEPIQKVFQTSGSYPVLVSCNDFNDYICKYSKDIPANKLFLEYLVANFAQLWELRMPYYRFVKLNTEHVPDSIAANYTKTKQVVQPTFGTIHLKEARELDDFLETLRGNDEIISKIKNPHDILKIALFDLWLSNEDRNHNNYNLLLNPEEDGYYFYVIDHEKCFNSSSLNYGIYHLSLDESLLMTDIYEVLFDKQSLAVIQSYLQKIEKEYYICIEHCQQKLKEIMDNIPDNWGIDVEKQMHLIQHNVFAESWIEETFSVFKSYIPNKQ